MKLKDYIELVDWTGKQIAYSGKAQIPAHLAPIFERLNLRQEQWLNQVSGYGSRYYRAVGHFDNLKKLAESLNIKWIKGIRAVKDLYKIPV